MPSIIQFFHPGGEHRPDSDCKTYKSWNMGAHKRKFMKSKGTYIENGKEKKGELLFWGEWEPPSNVEKLLIKTEPPKYLHSPLLPSQNKIKKYQREGYANTDPFIFGDCFKYAICMQESRPSLKNLEDGSLILFGSRVNFRFVIDTVFVVKRSQEYTTPVGSRFSNLGLYPELSLKMGETNCGNNQHSTRRLYFGATVKDHADGMYSFVPAQKSTSENQGFPRISMPLDFYSDKNKKINRYFSEWKNGKDGITEGQNAGIKSTIADIKDIKCLWEYIKRTVIQQKYLPGVHFEMPVCQ